MRHAHAKALPTNTSCSTYKSRRAIEGGGRDRRIAAPTVPSGSVGLTPGLLRALSPTRAGARDDHKGTKRSRKVSRRKRLSLPLGGQQKEH